MANLPVSPYTGQPSRLRAQINRSVGLQPDGTQQQAVKVHAPASVERGPTAGELSARIARALQPFLSEMARLTILVGEAIDRADRVQPVERASYAQPESYDSFIMRAAGGVPGRVTTLPLPPTGPVAGQMTCQVVTHAPTTPAGMAAAAVNYVQQGPDPTRFGINMQRAPGTVSVHDASRRNLGVYGRTW